jgi:hypothetical protein
MPVLNVDNARQMMDLAARRPAPLGDRRFDGRGVVICAGGFRYFTCAWVCVNLLRHHGCRLPIQLWHLGADEMTNGMRALVAPLDVECVDALELQKRHPARVLRGWELKPYSIINCPFREVLLLDADNVPLTDPEYLFDGAEYHRAGAVFWPDFGRLRPDRTVWPLAGIPCADEQEFETGTGTSTAIRRPFI